MSVNKFSQEFNLIINENTIDFQIYTNRRYPQRDAMFLDYIDMTLLELADMTILDMFLIDDKTYFPTLEYECDLIIKHTNTNYYDMEFDIKLYI